MFLCYSIFGQTEFQYFDRWESGKTKVGSQVLDIYQDHTGYIWLCTFNGLIRYDGQEFRLAEEIYPEIGEISTQHISTFAQDDNGCYWIGTIEEGIFRLTSDGRVDHIDSLGLRNHFDDQRPHTIISLDNQLFVIGRQGLSHFKINDTSEILQQVSDTLLYPHVRGGIITHNHLVLATKDRIYSPMLQSMLKLGLNEPDLFLDPTGDLWMANQENVGIVIYHYRDGQWEQANDQPFNKLKGQYHFNWDNENRLWAFKRRHHVICYDFTDHTWVLSLESDRHNLKNANVRDVLTDNSGTVWIGSEEVSIVKTHPRLTSYIFNDQPVEEVADLLYHGDTTIIAASNGDLAMYVGDQLVRFIDSRKEDFRSGSVSTMTRLSHNLIGISQIGGFQLRDNNLNLIDRIAVAGSCRSMLKIDSLIWIGAPNQLITYNENNGAQKKYSIPRPKKGETRYVNAICKKSDTELYLGLNHQPLMIYDISKDSFFQAPYSLQNINPPPKNINHIDQSTSGVLAIATGKGLHLYDGKKYIPIFPNKYFKSTAWITDNIVAATDNASIYIYDLEKNESHHISQDHGLINKRFELRSSSAMEGKVCFGGDVGLDCVSAVKSVDSATPLLWVESLTVNHEQHYSAKKFPKILSRNTNHIDVSVHQMYTKDPDGAAIFYRVNMAPWNKVSHNHITFENPKSGNYSIDLESRVNDVAVESSLLNLSFFIKKPFYAELWFWLLSLTFSSLFISLLINRTTFKKKEKEIAASKLRADISELRLKSLSAQMNPHFTFNALNSMQQMISEGDTIGATKYIHKFSAILRFVLEYAEDSWVTIDDEIEFLKTYMDMEQMRFDHSFHFEIKIDPLLKKSAIRIPPFFIQPQLENAIKHGIRPLDKGGIIRLSVSKNEDHLQITIRDNGVGREVSSKSNRQTGTHKGISIINGRIELLNRESNSAAFKTIDLKDKNGNASGTETITRLPYKQ